MPKKDPLRQYRSMRDFSRTAEPSAGGVAGTEAPVFVVQKHWATRLHYDFRLELDGSLKSWAVPKGPSLDPADKRMAVHVEDHPIAYKDFEGTIPPRQYGAGKVIIWDQGVWKAKGDAARGYREGKLKFTLEGSKLRGGWTLVRMRGKSEKNPPWLLIKENDAHARPSGDFSIVDEMPDSVAGPQAAPDASLPATLQPQLATLVDAPPADADQWLFEAKFDGYRVLARVAGGVARLYTRSGLDWTRRLKPLAQAAGRLPDGWYDGEIVVLNADGVPDFQALQGSFDNGSPESVVYYLFDLPYSQGRDQRRRPLVWRRERLAELLDRSGAPADTRIRFSESFNVPAADLLDSACRLGLEGLIGKRKDSFYVPGRSLDWIKLKCGHRQEFVVVGYTEPRGTRIGVGALLLAVHDENGKLRYAGKVGSGFRAASLPALRKRLEAVRAPRSALASTAGTEKGALWVRPDLMAEVSFAQWTGSGRIRHAVFHGLRNDKPPRSISRETSMPAKKTTSRSARVSHPERIVDATTGTRKIDVVDYYADAAPLLIEHLKDRPVSLLRAPDGVTGQMFFQKHLGPAKIPGVRELARELDPGHDPLMEIPGPEGLLSAAQMNVIEFHTWNARKTLIAKPDRMTFDLDPGKGVAWPAVQEAALILRAFLNELELTGFIKTSGGKGLHVVVPLQRRHDWDTVKSFSRDVVAHLARTLPRHFSARSGPRNRVGKIFIDYLRNGFGATTVSAWSLRARPGMGVSVPIRWDEVASLEGPQHWRLENIRERLGEGNTPWMGYAKAAATLTRAARMLKRAAPSRARRDAE
ncbi:DNA ligase D [Parapusillimonas granuli]|uniref:DNA ligase (ATP) n=1 Tax=Parapusillimonas granuli TaxID=380911 RepID=A0A853G068_9BURK|nr:DNA ligase D [Parapusillimonas granuli]MBB5216696.1 bifunctional non-homologous end joining protein LigD [Parapusillimonas granuli]MEB2400025.1 DNA ligase D [Alcaligenaceae bacterium]NYT51755.1 DNA ligase D [Parapusillimonas granuli]